MSAEYSQFLIWVDYSEGTIFQQEAHQLVGQAKRLTTKIRSKAVIAGIFGRFGELREMPIRISWWRYIWCRCRLQQYGWPCRIWWFYVKRWPNDSTLWRSHLFLCTFVQYLIALCSRLEEASDVISGTFVGLTVADKFVKFRHPRLNRFG